MYAVEFSNRSGRDLINMAKKRTNVIRAPHFRHFFPIPSDHIVAIIEDARYPQKYRMLLSLVDVIFADVAQPDQARIVGINAHQFLKNGGHAVISIKANCIDSLAPAEVVFASEVKRLQTEMFKPLEQLTLEVRHTSHALVAQAHTFLMQPYERVRCLLNQMSSNNLFFLGPCYADRRI